MRIRPPADTSEKLANRSKVAPLLVKNNDNNNNNNNNNNSRDAAAAPEW